MLVAVEVSGKILWPSEAELSETRATSRFWRLTLGRSLALYSHMCSMKQF